jgi:hypothetical protein
MPQPSAAENGDAPRDPGPKKETKRHLNKTFPQITQSACRDVPKIRFEQFAETWPESYPEINVKLSTLARYRDIIDRVFPPALSEIRLYQLQAFHVLNGVRYQFY